MLRNKNKGITLVALVITIIILLILAGISISTLTNTGIFQKAKETKQKSENAQKEEKSLLSEYEKEIIKQDTNGIWDGNVNKPELMSGMKAANFEFNEEKAEYEINSENIDVNNKKDEWYNYDAKKWANAQTGDGSMWVWIPRYAYKVVYNDPNDKSKGGKFDIVFLIGTTDNYIDDNGIIQTAQRQTEKNQVIETDSTKTDKYTVHPAFTNESNIGFQNGGWDKELNGIWVAKFEAGFFDKESEKLKNTSITYSQNICFTTNNIQEPARNYLDGIYGDEKKTIRYPTFQGGKYSMNFIGHNDAFRLSQILTEDNNIYGFSKNSTDSHLMKNSEWGAIAYLSQSKYGLEGKNIRINNVSANDEDNFVYAMTGYAATKEDAETAGLDNVYRWNEKEGQVASNTGTIYGIYDLSGGTWERMASLILNGNKDLETYGISIKNALNNGNSSKYVTVYNSEETNIESKWENLDIASKINYEKNRKYGDAVFETSIAGIGNNAWLFGNGNDYSHFPGFSMLFFMRGGRYFYASAAGLYSFDRADGMSACGIGFRPVLVGK